MNDSTSTNVIQTHSLRVLADATRYNAWVYSFFAHSVGKHVLELGCGTGTFTRQLLLHTQTVTAVDLDPAHVTYVQQTLEVPSGKQLFARCQDARQAVSSVSGFDTVVMLNVLEHIEDRPALLSQIYNQLPAGGCLWVLVPAHQWLYSPFDKSIGHYLRYDKPTLRGELESAGFQLEMLRWFNWAGIPGWWWNFCLRQKRTMSPRAVGWFEHLVPVLRPLESIAEPPLGLSLLALARKPL